MSLLNFQNFKLVNMNIFKRIFKIGQAEAHSMVDKLEDPIKLIEQGIRDLKAQLDQGLNALAEVKALAIRSGNEMNASKEKAKDYENKAILLLKKVQKGDLDEVEGDRLATEVLLRKDEQLKTAAQRKTELDKFNANIATLDNNIKKLKTDISSYESELKTLRARVKVSSATKNINKHMAQLDDSGTVSMLERMKDKISKDEALAEAYGDIANDSASVDQEIDAAIGDAGKENAADALAKLKDKLGMNEN